MKRKFENDVGNRDMRDNPPDLLVPRMDTTTSATQCFNTDTYTTNKTRRLDFGHNLAGPTSAETHGVNVGDVSVSTAGAWSQLRRHDHAPGLDIPLSIHSRTSTPCMSKMDAVREAELRRVIDGFVSVYEQLDKTDDVTVKPNYSYTELAFLAMLKAPNFCLPINEIYRYIKSRFLFYRNSTRKHWKNAVRHSLAKTMCFTKIAVGRGVSNSEKLSRSTYLWCIVPSSISCFARGDYRPGVDKESGTNTLRWGYYRVNAGRFWEDVGDYVANKMTSFRRLMDDSHTPGLVFEAQVCRLGVTGVPDPNRRRVLQERPINIMAAGQHNTAYQVDTVKRENFTMTSSTDENTVAYNVYDVKPTSQCFENIDQHRLQCHGPTSGISLPLTLNLVHDDNAFNGTETSSIMETNDAWLSNNSVSRNDVSLSSMVSGRRTPPYTLGDSGFETCDSSPEETSSCRFLSSRDGTNAAGTFGSPCFDNSSGYSDVIGSLELSEFSLNELSDFSVGLNSTDAMYKENVDFLFSPNNLDHITERACTPPGHVTQHACYDVNAPLLRAAPPVDHQLHASAHGPGLRFTATPPLTSINQSDLARALSPDAGFVDVTPFKLTSAPEYTSTPFARQCSHTDEKPLVDTWQLINN